MKDLTKKLDLLNNNELFSFIDDLPDGLLFINSKGSILKSNKKASGFFPVPAIDESNSAQISDFIYPEDHSKFLNNLEWFLTHRNVRPAPIRFLDTNKQPFWLEVHISTIGGITCLLLKDISNLKKLEDDLFDAEERYKTLLETAEDVIIIVDMEGNHLFRNHSYYKSLGYEIGEDINHKGFGLVHPDDHSIIREGVKTINELGSYYAQYRVKNKAGDWIYRSTRGTLLRDKKGSPSGYIAIMRDITDQKNYEKELEISKKAADAANSAKSQFLALMSHEIRTPISGILGMTDLLLDTHLNDVQNKYLSLIKESGNILLQLINDILDISKIEAHKMDLEQIPFDLKKVLSVIINIFTFQASERGLKLYLQMDPDVPLNLIGDSRRLQQILTNLFNNAIKFTKEGNITLFVCLEDETRDAVTLKFSVRDTGIGIPSEKLNSIFEPFTQVDGSTTRHFGGSGLGLTICRQLSELMGGKFSVKSRFGTGSVFTFTVCLKKQDNTIDIPNETSGSYFSESLPFYPEEKIILIAEDDPINQVLIQEILRKAGYQVALATNGNEVIFLLERNKYDLIIMDCMMPGKNGIDTTVEIRKKSSRVFNPDLPIIALTANAMPEDMRRCMKAGMSEFLTKPVDSSLLLETVKKHLLVFT